MAKARITSNAGEGLYGIELEYDSSSLDNQIEALKQQLIDIEQIVLDARVAVFDAEDVRDSLADDLDDAIDAYAAGGSADPVIAATRALAEAVAQLNAARLKAKRLIGQKLSLAARKTQLENTIIGSQASASDLIWCADYSTDLAADAIVPVAIPPGEIGPGGEPWVILPQQHPDGYGGSYDRALHGQLVPRLSMTPAATFYNWAVLPGWQRWMPTHRIGTLTFVDQGNDTCTVTLDTARSSADPWPYTQGLNVNRAESTATVLTGVPIRYMTCNAAVFESGDRVLVRFAQPAKATAGPGAWDDAEVVGFVTDPRPCGGISAVVGASIGGAGTQGRQFLFIGERPPNENTLYPGTVLEGVSADSARHNGVDFISANVVRMSVDGSAVYGGGRYLTPLPSLLAGWSWRGADHVAARPMGDDIVVVGLQRQSGIDQLYMTGYYRPFGVYAAGDNGLYDAESNPTGWRQINLEAFLVPWSVDNVSSGMWHPTESTYLCFQRIRTGFSELTSNYRAIELVITPDSVTDYRVDATLAREWVLDAEHTVEVGNVRETPLDNGTGPGFDEYIYGEAPDATGSFHWHDAGARSESGARGELIDVFYDANGVVQGVILQSTYSLAYQYSRNLTRNYAPHSNPDFEFGVFVGGEYDSQFTRSAQSDMTLLVGETLSIPWGSFTETYTPLFDDSTLCYGPDENIVFRFSTQVFATQTVTTAYRRKQLQFVDYRKGIFLYMENRRVSVRTITVDGVYNPNNAPGCAPESGGVTVDRNITTEIHWGLYNGFQEAVPLTKLADDTFTYDQDFTPGVLPGYESIFSVSIFALPNPGNDINSFGPYGLQPGRTDSVGVIPWEYSDLEVISEYAGHPGGYSADMWPWDPAWYADSDGKGNMLYSGKLTSYLQSEEVANPPTLINHSIALFGDDLFDPIAQLPDGVTLKDEDYLPQLIYIHAFS